MGTRGAIGYILSGKKIPVQFHTNTDFFVHLDRAIAHVEKRQVYLDSGVTSFIQDKESYGVAVVWGNQCRAIIDLDKHTVQTENMSMPLTFREYENFDGELPEINPTLTEIAEGKYDSFISDL